MKNFIIKGILKIYIFVNLMNIQKTINHINNKLINYIKILTNQDLREIISHQIFNKSTNLSNKIVIFTILHKIMKLMALFNLILN